MGAQVEGPSTSAALVLSCVVARFSRKVLAMTVTPFVKPLLDSDLSDVEDQKWKRRESWDLTLHVVASCSIMFAGGFRATMIFPFASTMTEALRGDSTNVGFWTGVLLAAQALG